jgi:outer membrane receptor protein involved in Fe transport
MPVCALLGETAMSTESSGGVSMPVFWRKIFPVLSLLALLICQIPCLHGQVNTAGIRGSVVDQSGAVIPSASLVLRNDGTGLERTATTNDVGQYAFDYVPVGTYSITINQTGFQSQKRTGIELVAAQTARVDFSLKVIAEQQSVVVSADQEVMNTTTSEQTSTIGQVRVNELPVQRQDWTSLLQLGAGVSTQGDSQTPAGTTITMNGLPPAGFNLTLDGTNATSDPETPAFAFYQGPNLINTINNDAIQEVSVVKGIAPATVGGTMSGNVNIITKSGTNAFHGSLYEINEVSVYDARNQFLTSRPRTTFNEYGGSLGGKIIPNKLFFFGSYEGARVSSFTTVSGTVPTPYLKSISPSVYSDIFAAYPTVTQPSSDPTAETVEYNGTGSLKQNDGNAMVRLDYSLNSNNLITARYTRGRPYKNNPNVVSIDNRITTGHTDAYNASYTHLASRWTSFTRFGYNRLRLSRVDQGMTTDLEEIVFNGIDSNGAESFDKSGAFYTAEEGIAGSYGRHAIQIGGIFQRQSAGRTDLTTATIQYSTEAEYLANTPSKVILTLDLTPFNLHTNQYGLYFQDDYKLANNLTLNLGVRYDYFSVPKEDNGRVYNRGIDTSDPSLGAGFGDYRSADSMYNADYNNFQPRLGFTWNPGQDQKTIVRGGFGLFVSPHPIFGGPIEEVQTSATQPFRITLNSQQVANAGLQYPLVRGDFSQILTELQTSGTISSDFANTAINANFPNPYSIQWMLGVQRALPWGMSLEVDYTGNRGLKENFSLTGNLPDRITGVAPKPTFSEFRLYEAGDASKYDGLQTALNKSVGKDLVFGVNYVWSKAMSLGDSNLLLETAPQDADNIKADYGLSPFDVKETFSGNFLWNMPLYRLMNLQNRVVKTATDGWQLSGVISANTGMPANVKDNNSAYPSDRPDPVSGVNQYLGNSNDTLKYLNPAAFSTPAISSLSGAQIRGGYLGRDAVRQLGAATVNASLAKNFSITDKSKIQFRADTFNLLNHTNLSGLVTDISSGSFGQLTSATARTMQLALRLTF